MPMMTPKPVLLIGNGINNIASQYKWKDLVDELIRAVGATRRIRLGNKPFPLLYEEIVAHAVRERGKPESEIKSFIADRVSRFLPNEIHARIMRLGAKHILTTNYDHTLEMADSAQDSRGFRNAGVVKENLYSLFRFTRVRKNQVWHIHGDQNSPQSIALGYEHYSGYLQRMRNYVVMGTENAYTRQFDSLEARLRKGAVTFDSWIDFFFTDDIYIVGLSLDFIEMHLWWLLTYRARRKYLGRLPIKNRITYFYPTRFRSEIRDKLELLQANDVVTRAVSFKLGNWLSYYNRVLDQVERGVN